MRVFAFLLLVMAACANTQTTQAVQTECPKDELAARGKSCAPDGKTCGTNSAGFTHFIMCSRGKWVEMEAPPPPPPQPVPPT
jgi:hypothetical protein